MAGIITNMFDVVEQFALNKINADGKFIPDSDRMNALDDFRSYMHLYGAEVEQFNASVCYTIGSVAIEHIKFEYLDADNDALDFETVEEALAVMEQSIGGSSRKRFDLFYMKVGGRRTYILRHPGGLGRSKNIMFTQSESGKYISVTDDDSKSYCIEGVSMQDIVNRINPELQIEHAKEWPNTHQWLWSWSDQVWQTRVEANMIHAGLDRNRIKFEQNRDTWWSLPRFMRWSDIKRLNIQLADFPVKWLSNDITYFNHWLDSDNCPLSLNEKAHYYMNALHAFSTYNPEHTVINKFNPQQFAEKVGVSVEWVNSFIGDHHPFVYNNWLWDSEFDIWFYWCSSTRLLSVKSLNQFHSIKM